MIFQIISKSFRKNHHVLPKRIKYTQKLLLPHHSVKKRQKIQQITDKACWLLHIYTLVYRKPCEIHFTTNIQISICLILEVLYLTAKNRSPLRGRERRYFPDIGRWSSFWNILFRNILKWIYIYICIYIYIYTYIYIYIYIYI